MNKNKVLCFNLLVKLHSGKTIYSKLEIYRKFTVIFYRAML